MVMGMIYLLNHDKIATLLKTGAGVPDAIAQKGVGMGIAAMGVTNGLPEALVAAVIAPIVALALDRAMAESSSKNNGAAVRLTRGRVP